jgi:hypothetical protein
MYGVPPDLPLDRFLGQNCTLIAIGSVEIRFMFPSSGDICVYIHGRWEVCDDCGRMIDRTREHAERTCYFVHKILESPVHRYAIDAPVSFTLYFENGYSLTIFDDSEQYESFSIQPDGIYV